MTEKISEKLHTERRRRKETLKMVCSVIGCSTIYLSDVETGKKLPLDGKMLYNLAIHYGIDFENLIRTAYNQKCEEIIQKYKGVNRD